MSPLMLMRLLSPSPLPIDSNRRLNSSSLTILAEAVSLSMTREVNSTIAEPPSARPYRLPAEAKRA